MGNAGFLDIHKDVDIDMHKDSDKMVWVHADNDSDDDMHKTIKIIEKNGKETIIVNGKEVSREELEEIQKEDGKHEKHIKIKKSHGDKEENVFIMKMSDDDMDIDIIAEEKGKKVFFIKGDGDEKPMFIIDGKESKEKDMKKLDPSEIATVNVYKGEKAKEKYGKRGENGVVEITTKNQ